MRLTRQSEIAIAILMACARRAGTYVHTSVVATEADATKAHTSKIVHLLVQTGLLTSTRGRRGGLRLAKPAETILLSTVLRHTQPELFEGNASPSGRRSPLDTIVGTARGAFETLLERFTVSDLVAPVPRRPFPCADCRLLKTPRGAGSTSSTTFHERPEIHVPTSG